MLKEKLKQLVELGLTNEQAIEFLRQISYNGWIEHLNHEYNGSSKNHDEWFDGEILNI